MHDLWVFLSKVIVFSNMVNDLYLRVHEDIYCIYMMDASQNFGYLKRESQYHSHKDIYLYANDIYLHMYE